MSKKPTTIRDIADRLSVTTSTVSRALNGNPRISERMRLAVLKAATEMNYERNRVAAALRNGRTNIIGVMLPTINRNFFASIVRGIEMVAMESGFSVMLTQNHEDPVLEAANIRALLRAQVTGIIASVSKGLQDDMPYRSVVARGLPIVLFDRVIEDIGASLVVIDDFRGGYLATTHLIEQGCEHIVHLGGNVQSNIYQDRLSGYRQALLDHGKFFDPATSVFVTDQSVGDGEKAGRQLLARDRMPDGIFSASDWSAVGAMEVLKGAGVSIPEQVAVVGFANEPFTQYLEPSLTSIEQLSEEIGRCAAREFIIQSLTPLQDRPQPGKTTLDPQLVVRDSSRRLSG